MKQLAKILCKILKCQRIDLYTQKLVIPSNALTKINDCIEKRISGQPIQYILGSAPFYNRKFFVNNNVLIPRLDSELIIDILKNYQDLNNLLEIGTGSYPIKITDIQLEGKKCLPVSQFILGFPAIIGNNFD